MPIRPKTPPSFTPLRVALGKKAPKFPVLSAVEGFERLRAELLLADARIQATEAKLDLLRAERRSLASRLKESVKRLKGG